MMTARKSYDLAEQPSQRSRPLPADVMVWAGASGFTEVDCFNPQNGDGPMATRYR